MRASIYPVSISQVNWIELKINPSDFHVNTLSIRSVSKRQ